MRLSRALHDGYSFRILQRDLKYLYGNLPLGDPVAFSNYIQQWVKAQSHSEALDFWRNDLDGFQMPHIGDITDLDVAKPMQPYIVSIKKSIPNFEPPEDITQATIGKAA